ncbi:MAG TPA: hypothetical protein VL651_08100 [Bacteroidia bacterium]|jgi:hypothetical protein|nr:hypothetical protein [Bacteroidia bacterium]
MRQSRFLFFLLLILCGWKLDAQVTSSWRNKPVSAKGDSIQLDTLSIDPSTFEIFSGQQKLDSSQYKLLPADAMVILSPNAPRTDLRVKYAVYPLLFTKKYAHKDQGTYTVQPNNRINPFLYVPSLDKTDDPFAMGGLNKSGSLSRGISFGNTRDLSVNSSLNLQLSGRLTEGVDLLMAATDDNLPIQPDGTTQQLQEFDKVYIQLSGSGTKLIAGDFTAGKPDSYFMNFNKRGQGIFVSTIQPMGINGKDTIGKLNVSASVALSKGKFARNIIQGTEGNQGPYHLHGAENELFIIILSGTEQVYLDGKLLTRGQENDYTINYNTGEITFTAKQPITKDKRITVEFQYSDRNYTRTMYYSGIEYEHNKNAVRFNYYSEQDARNQPLQQTLTDSDKVVLANVGDTLLHAVVPGVDSIAFSGDQVLYRKVDTTVASTTYNDVYVYSTDPNTAHFRLSFSYVGLHNGNYVEFSSSANGKTYKWVAPVAGVPQGDHEPVILLITPKKKQMITAGGTINTPLGIVDAELAMTTNDLNTFSSFDSFDDKGYAGTLKFASSYDIGGPNKLLVDARYERTSRYFNPIERYRPVEFERDWNFNYGSTTTRTPTTYQELAGISFGVKGRSGNLLGYDYGMFHEGTAFRGAKNSVSVNWTKSGFNVTGKGSLLQTVSDFGNTSFIRQNLKITQALNDRFSLSGSESQETNHALLPGNDSLISPSAAFLEWESDLNYKDSSDRSFTFFYKQRRDELPSSSELARATFAENLGGTIGLSKNPNRELKITASWRKLTIEDSTLTQQQPDNTIVGRIEYNLIAAKKIITANTFYETGSGLEVKKQYTYIEVPAGQGNYTWTDYNGDGVKQLNEFENALYVDQANYIRVFTPTNDYQKVYTNQFSLSLNIRPYAVWGSSKGFKGFVGRFSDQVSYQVDRKTSNKDPKDIYLPLISDLGDTALVTLNASIRNTFSFNQLSSKFGMDYLYQDVSGKNLLTNGLESRRNYFHEGRIKWNINQSFSITNSTRTGFKTNSSEYFSTRNYRIRYTETEPKFSYQPGTTFRVSLDYRFSDKNNAAEFGGDKANVQKFGTELKFSKVSKGSITAEADYYRITFTGNVNSSVGYDMLEGLKPGQNMTWKVSWQRSLATNLQLTVGYEGRKSPGNKVIHTGSAQVRAIF